MSASDPSREQALARAMAELWDRFRVAALERVDVLDRAGEAAASGDLSTELRSAARTEAHKLVGSLGSFGVHGGTALAREAERLLDRTGEAGDPGRLRVVAAELRAVVEAAEPGGE